MYSSNAVVKPITYICKTSNVISNPETKAINRILTNGLSKITRKFQRDDGMCPECFAEMKRTEGTSTCDLCGYCECD